MAVALLSTLPSTVKAESLQTDIIPAEASWVIHIDVGNFATSPLKDLILGKGPKDIRRGIKTAEGIAKIDFFNDISSITLIGSGHGEEPAVVVKGKFDKKYLLDLMALEKDVEKSSYGKYDIYNEDGDENYVFAGDNLIIIGEEEDFVKKILDVVDGKAKSISSSSFVSAIKNVPATTLITAAAKNVSKLVDDNEASVILKKTGLAFFLAMEQNDLMKLKLSLETDSPETAKNILQIANGLKALVQMKHDKEVPHIDILSKINTSIDGSTILAELSTPSVNLLIFLGLVGK